MKATEAKFLDFLKKSPQFVIPIYQRTYSWTERECRELWDDILRTGVNDDISAHFVGSIVYIEEGLYQVSSQTPLLVIDGQQRLTTVTLILEALARHVGDDEPLDGFSAKKLRNYYLLNHLEDGDRAFKLLLTQTDKASLLALVQQNQQPSVHSLRIAENFEFFEEKLRSLSGDLEALCKGLTKLVVVDISLSRDQDNPQLIFESMNSTGRELSQADLIRNFVLMGLAPAHQTKLYEDHWRPMEVEFGQEGYGKLFDDFMRYYLTFRTGDTPNVNAVYEAFKEYFRLPDVADDGVDALIAEVHMFAGYYCAMALGKEPDKRLAQAFHDLRELKVNVAYPFLLELYHDYTIGVLSLDDFEQAIRLVESYVFRRAVCGIPTNSLNKTFETFSKALQKDRYITSIQAHLLLMPSYRRFPKNDEFRHEFKMRDLYNFPRRSYWLRRLENHGHKERVAVDEYTIEHIMPQNENLSQEWRKELGDDWERVHEEWLHTLGNLTLTGYNSEYSDRPFREKRDMDGGYAQSKLKLNADLGSYEKWDETAIQKRADILSKQAAQVWPRPEIDVEALERYRPKVTKRASYSIEDHPTLNDGAPMQSLFQALRKEIVALDPCVTEEFLKRYVAYKAESNFLDIVGRKNFLRLYFGLKFRELQDPRDVCKDVSELGRWGNGEVAVEVRKAEDLPYVIGLARQALEKQLGENEHS